MQMLAVNTASYQQKILNELFTVVQRTPGGLMIKKPGLGKVDLQLLKIRAKCSVYPPGHLFWEVLFVV